MRELSTLLIKEAVRRIFTLLTFLEWKRDWAFSRNKCLARILDLLHLGITVSPHFQRIDPLPLKGVWFGFSNFPTEVK